MNKKKLLINQGTYIRDGCLLLLDSIDNTRQGYNPNTNVWEDLSGTGNDYEIKQLGARSIWMDGKLRTEDYPGGAQRTAPLNGFGGLGELTIEVVINVGRMTNSNICNYFACMEQTADYTKGLRFTFVRGYKTYLYNGSSLAASYETPEYGGYVYGMRTEHIRVTESRLDHFRDGVLLRSFSIPAGAFLTANALSSINANNAMMYCTDVYGCRLYNRALSDGEIARNYAVDRQRYKLSDKADMVCPKVRTSGVNLGNAIAPEIWAGDFAFECSVYMSAADKDVGSWGVINFNDTGQIASNGLFIGGHDGNRQLRIIINGSNTYTINGFSAKGAYRRIRLEKTGASCKVFVDGLLVSTLQDIPQDIKPRVNADYLGAGLPDSTDNQPTPNAELKDVKMWDSAGTLILDEFYKNKPYTAYGTVPIFMEIVTP